MSDFFEKADEAGLPVKTGTDAEGKTFHSVTVSTPEQAAIFGVVLPGSGMTITV